MISLGFNIKRTPMSGEVSEIESSISGKSVLFTGTMVGGNRKDMQVAAEEQGAIVVKSISKKTDIVVIGEKAGQSKLDKIAKINAGGGSIAVMTEVEWNNYKG